MIGYLWSFFLGDINPDSPYLGDRRRQYGWGMDQGLNQWNDFIFVHGSRCSALVRFSDLNSELFVGHSTWEPFSEMTRIVKFYNFPFKGIAARRLAFPSYPGAITSTDDFIVTSARLVLSETTIDVRNRSLFRERSNIKSGQSKEQDLTVVWVECGAVIRRIYIFLLMFQKLVSLESQSMAIFQISLNPL